jgi:hypothetical protein
MGEEIPVPERKPPFLERRRQRKEEEAEAPAPSISTPTPTPESKQPLLDRLRQRREEKTDEVKSAAAMSTPSTTQDSAPTPEKKPPLLERFRQRKTDEPAAPSIPATEEAPRIVEQKTEVASEPTGSRPAGATSKPVTAEELRGARPAIGGRLRWSEGEESTAVVPAPPVGAEPHRAPPKSVWPIETGGVVGPRWISVFLLHLVLAMAAGVVLVGATAAIASVVSDGTVALLEMRGLPIFIGGATAVMLFTLLRTGRGKPESERRSVIVGVVVGFIVLVVASTLLFQPRVIERAQAELEKALGVYGDDETKAVEDFANDINVWNTETSRYRDAIISPLLRGDVDMERFRVAAAGSEETLNGTVRNMQTHADSAANDKLRDALGDFAAIYEARLSAIRLITRGLVSNDQALVNSGETRRDASKASAVEFFDRRLKPILERADIDTDSFGASVAGGY